MRAISILLCASALLFGACGGTESEPELPPDTSTRSGDASAGGSTDATTPPPIATGDCAHGVHGAGEPPAGCDFVVATCCYPTHEEACAAAGCEPAGCISLESYPAQVRCN